MGSARIDEATNRRSHRSGKTSKRHRELVYAVVHQVPDRTTPGMSSICGLPLIARQIEWLLGIGCDGVVVEAKDDEASAAVASFVSESYGTDFNVRVVVTGASQPIGTREVARRAGIASHRPVLAVPADLLGDGDLTRMVSVPNPYGVVAFFEAPKTLVRTIGGGTVRLVRESLSSPPGCSAGQPTPVRGPGWGVRLQSQADVDAFTNAALRGEVPSMGDAPNDDVQRVA